MNRKVSKQKEDELALVIQNAIDDYCKAGCKNFFLTAQEYDLGYEIKLSIKKVKYNTQQSKKEREYERQSTENPRRG